MIFYSLYTNPSGKDQEKKEIIVNNFPYRIIFKKQQNGTILFIKTKKGRFLIQFSLKPKGKSDSIDFKVLILTKSAI